MVYQGHLDGFLVFPVSFTMYTPPRYLRATKSTIERLRSSLPSKTMTFMMMMMMMMMMMTDEKQEEYQGL
jgi:hypothetical protein